MYVRHTIGHTLLYTLARPYISWFCHINSYLSPVLLLLDRLARPLAGTCIRSGALTTDGQTTAMAHAPVRSQIHQPFDIHADVTAQIALDHLFTHLQRHCL